MNEPAAPATQRSISASDIGNLFGLPIMALISWLLPASAAALFAHAVGPINLKVLTSDEAELIGRVAALVGDRALAMSPGKIPRALASEDVYALFWVLRSHSGRPFAWPVAIEGLEHLEAALAAGNGAIAWRPHLVHGCIPLFKAFQDAGHPLIHLSHVRHGFSETTFGIRVLNPMRTAAEDRYLETRVERTDAAPTVALRTLMRNLGENAVVSMATRGDAERWIEVPFLAGADRIAPGAPHLAYTRGAPLLPVFPVRNPDESYTITIGEPLPVDTSLPREAAIETAAREMARRLEPYVLAHPEQWLGWAHIQS